MSRSQSCALCGLPPSRNNYSMPDLEVRGSHGNLLERQAALPWPVCSDCDVFVGARDAPGLSGRIVPLLANRAGHPLSVAEEEHVKARHLAFFAALAPQQQGTP